MATLVIGDTDIYIQKSDNFHFQRRTYSMHKGSHFVKPMVIFTIYGYSILGAYFQNSRRTMLLHANIIRQWVKEQDVRNVDRGFQYSLQVLEDLGIKVQMLPFLMKHFPQKMQHIKSN